MFFSIFLFYFDFYFIFSPRFCFFTKILFFTKISFFPQVASGVLQPSLFVENRRVRMINLPSVWHPQASFSGLQPCRDTRHNPCDYTPNTRFHSFFCYLSPFKMREYGTLLYVFYKIKKINLFFSFYIFYVFLFFLFFLINQNANNLITMNCRSHYRCCPSVCFHTDKGSNLEVRQM